MIILFSAAGCEVCNCSCGSSKMSVFEVQRQKLSVGDKFCKEREERHHTRTD